MKVVSQQVPPPPSVDLQVITQSSLKATISPPIHDGGSPIQSYRVDWDPNPGVQEIQTIQTSVYIGPNAIQSITTSAPRVDEVQTFQTSSNPISEQQVITLSRATGGYYFLEFDTSASGGSLQYSGFIRVDYPASGSTSGQDVQSILSSMSNIAPFGSPIVTKSIVNADLIQFTVTFPLSMGNVPLLSIHAEELSPAGIASASVETVVEGNVLSGSFKLSFDSFTTSSLPFDASAESVRLALEALPNMGTTIVQRSGPDDQRGFTWTVQFASPQNSGDVPPLTMDTSLLSVSSPLGTPTVSYHSQNGNQIGGTFTLTFNSQTTNPIPFDASDNVLKLSLESLSNIPSGSISVSRSGPDGQRGYRWFVSFLSDPTHAFEGPQNDLVFNPSGLTGYLPSGLVHTERVGTQKSVQLITVTPNPSNSNAASDLLSQDMQLSFLGRTTQHIPLRPTGSLCTSDLTEVQTITTTTFDTTQSGGDADVSMYLQFRLGYGSSQTNWIKANPTASNDCSQTAKLIQSELQSLPMFSSVSVDHLSTANFQLQQTCVWTVSFLSAIGNIDQLTVQARNSVLSSVGTEGSSSTAGKDMVTIETTQDGQIDEIKYALELLDTVGTVSVTPVSTNQGSNGECSWKVTFDTNAGSLPLLQVTTRDRTRGTTSNTGSSLATLNSGFTTVTVAVTEVSHGTSSAIGGSFALEFRGSRTKYMVYNVDYRTLKDELNNLDTIGFVDVTRSNADENGGFTWSVTFLNNYGPQPLLYFDGADMTGTVVQGSVSRSRIGVPPSFDSNNGLPFGTAVLTDLSSLNLIVPDLDEAIPYYFRAAAINSIGQGPFTIAELPLAPVTQRPSPPVNLNLSVVDGSTLALTFDPSQDDGGQEISLYNIEYATAPFAPEIQEIIETCVVTPAVQEIHSSTTLVPEEQLIYLSTSFSGIPATEVQQVVCDATGGNFRLVFNGKPTSPIPYNADLSGITNALQQLEVINSVSVTWTATSQTSACRSRADCPGCGFQVTFTNVVGMSGNLPLMTATTNSLLGLRFVQVTRVQLGSADLGGSFRLSFRGFTTQDINAAISQGTSVIAQNIKTALSNLDSIPSGGVTVSYVPTPLSTFSYLFRVVFTDSRLGGDVQALQNVQHFNQLTGSSVSISIMTDGTETLQQRGGATSPSKAGNQLGGNFTLSYRGHTTSLLDYNADESSVKRALEELPNIERVKVVRTGPSVLQEFTWTVTFLDMPGAYPVGSESVDNLQVHFVPSSRPVSGLTGTNALLSVTPTASSAGPLSGSFALNFFSLDANNHVVSESTALIPSDALSTELESIFNSMNSVGTVSVTRNSTSTGYIWSVTFDGCKMVNGADVCNKGNLNTMTLAQSSLASGCSVKVMERQSGHGPDAGQLILPSSDLPTYSTLIPNLQIGQKYYVQVSAHNSQGFGSPALSSPLFQIPMNNPPSAPPPVRLVSSTDSSLSVEWDAPRENGGSPVSGYQLWMDDWAGGAFRLVYDGTESLQVTSFSISSSTSFPVELGKSYRLQVRAINYCSSTDSTAACYSPFSDVSVFAVRSPRSPLAPPAPYRHSSSNSGSQLPNSASITIRWNAPIDNGGSPIVKYSVFWASPDVSSFSEVALNSIPSIDSANGIRTMQWTFPNLKNGYSYRFYIVAINSIGRSPSSPVLTVVAGMDSGLQYDTNTGLYLTAYAQSTPTITSVSSSLISLNWPAVSSLALGGLPVQGYRVYMSTGASSSSLSTPISVLQEVQVVQTTAPSKVPEIQQVTLPLGLTSFALSIYGKMGASTLDYTKSQAQIQSYIVALLTGQNNFPVGGSVTVSPWFGTTSKSFQVTFTSIDGPVDLLVVQTTPLNQFSNTTVIQSASSPLTGSFTLTFNGSQSVDLPVDISASELQFALQDLPGVGHVSVVRNLNLASDGTNRNAYSWAITFDSLSGDLPLLYATGGRILPTSAAIKVSKYVSGTPSVLVFDGASSPTNRSATISVLPDRSYAFKVVPVNSLGQGILSGQSQTVSTTAGASATYTTASGSSLSSGITGVVNEIQLLKSVNCGTSNMVLGFGSQTAIFANTGSESDLESQLSVGLLTGPVSVSFSSDLSSNTHSWLVTFLSGGDVPSLSVSPALSSPSCIFSTSEFLKGNNNQFTIEPKTSTGSVLIDTGLSSGFSGRDIFFTESFYANGTWARDQGVATFHPTIFSVQSIFFPASYSSSVTLSFPDYLTPESTATLPSLIPISISSSESQVQIAIQNIINIDSVQVHKSVAGNGDVTFLVTFLSNLGPVPDLIPSASQVTVHTVTTGVTEVQTVSVASDKQFSREEQQFKVDSTLCLSSLSLSFQGSSPVSLACSSLSAISLTSKLQSILDSDGTLLSVVVHSATLGQLTTFTVRFISPVGDLPNLVVSYSNGASIFVTESIKGTTPEHGTFTLFYENEYTDDIPFDASALQMKTLIEALPSLNNAQVKVDREVNSNGFKWTVSFVQSIGNLRMLQASPYRYEVQSISLTGGIPTPIDGLIQLSYGGYFAVVPFNASKDEMKSALEAMPSVGRVDVSKGSTLHSGQTSWLITFRDQIGNIENLGVDSKYLSGSSPLVEVAEVVSGDSQSLRGHNPRLEVLEKVAGLPDYTAQYFLESPGQYLTKVSQLTQGGLLGTYYNNQWEYGTPSLERIDSTLNFDWSSGPITSQASDYVSVVWKGKFRAPTSDTFTFFVSADDSVAVWFDHVLVVDTTVEKMVSNEQRFQVDLVEGSFFDLEVHYVELTGSASLKLFYSSTSIRKQIVPSNTLYFSEPILGSPFNTTVLPGAADYPFTQAFGSGLIQSTAGLRSTFFIQTKDSLGNNQSTDFESFDPMDMISVTLSGVTTYFADVEYLGEGLFQASYLPLRAGTYSLSVQMGDKDIQCGLGEALACSPFSLVVEPGRTVGFVSEAESPSAEVMDYLAEAVVGESAYFYLQAKDNFGNNQIRGGDDFKVQFTLQSNTNYKFRGTLLDNQDGTYLVRYTLPKAGFYEISITLESDSTSDQVLTCVGASSPFVFTRVYDGISAYVAPSFCSSTPPVLKVVHNQLHTPTTTFNDLPDQSLAFAVVGTENSFTVEARDSFGNIRSGDSTTHFVGYGDGQSDYFLVEFSQQETGDRVLASSAVEVLNLNLPNNQPQPSFFRLSFGGRTTPDIPCTISDVGLEAILESLHDFQLDVIVSKTSISSVNAQSVQSTWRIEFLTMLDVFQSKPPMGPATGSQLQIQPGSIASVHSLMTLTRPASAGLYPVSFTLWYTGSYVVRITNNGVDIQGSPTTINVRNAPVDPSASVVSGLGLEGGVAGQSLSFQVQAMDSRRPSVQYLVSSAFVTSFVNEVQKIQVGSSSFKLIFRGQQTSTLTLGTSTYANLFSALSNLHTLSSGFHLIDSTHTHQLDSSSTVIHQNDIFYVRFADSTGPMPLLTSTDSSMTIHHEQVGDAPFRRAVQEVACSAVPSGSLFVQAGSQSSPVPVAQSSSNGPRVRDIKDAVEKLGYGLVSITSPTNSLISSDLTISFCLTHDHLLIQFDEYLGPVPSLIFTPPGTTVTRPQTADLAGIFPIYGTFTIGTRGENTTALSTDATAYEVEAALEALYSVGDVSVTKERFGLPFSSDGSTLFYYPYNLNTFNIWTIKFDGVCTNSPSSASCPTSLGNEPLLFVNNQAVDHLSSPYTHQRSSQIVPQASVQGYPGNPRVGLDELSQISVSLQHRTQPSGSSIGMNSIQSLYCKSLTTSSFYLRFLNDTILVDSSFLGSQLSDAMNNHHSRFNLDPTYTVSVGSPQSPICSSAGSTTIITFLTPLATSLPLLVPMQVSSDLVVQVTSDVWALDSLVGLANGKYSVAFTPRVAGAYDIYVRINGQDVSTDLREGLFVQPGSEYAPSSTHNISQVNTEGVDEYFAIQLRDKFGNPLSGPMIPTSDLIVSMEGIVDSCVSSSIEANSIPVKMVDNSPYTDGQYLMSYLPTRAGSYEVSVKLVTRGGLLGTYYKTRNFTDPVLASLSNYHDGQYHDPYWCDGYQLGNFSSMWTQLTGLPLCDSTISDCGCDSTKLDTQLSFDFGYASPLPYDEPDSGRFPADFYSIRWEGFLTAPATGVFSFTVTSDFGAKFVLNGIQYLDSTPMSSKSSSFSVFLNANDRLPIEISYVHARDASQFSVTWSGPGVPANSILGGDALSYARHVMNSPITVQVYPGAVDPSQSLATGLGLTSCVSLHECSFVIQARDSSGNNIYNMGTHSWDVQIVGSGDWAADENGNSRVNDVPISGPQIIPSSVTPLGWEWIGTGSVSYGSDVVSSSIDVSSLLTRGDTILVGQEVMMIDLKKPFSSFSIPLARPYLGDSLTSFDLVKLTPNCTAGQYLVQYTPSVRGSYSIHVKVHLSDEILGSPFQLTVQPDQTSASFSTSFGPGLISGITGETSFFTIQSKDAFGNNRLSTQSSDSYRVYAFHPNSNFGSSYEGEVSYVSGSEGLYRASFVPTLSGPLTILPLLATQFEVQNLTASWPSLSSQTGYFVLTFCPESSSDCQSTKRLSWNANGSEVESAINSLQGIGQVSVSFSQSTDFLSFAWTVTFLSVCDVPSLSLAPESTVPIQIQSFDGLCELVGANDPSLPYPAGPYVNGQIQEETQLISVQCNGAVSDCSFALTFRGQTTSLVPFNSAPSTLKLELESLSSIGTVSVSLDPSSTSSLVIYVVTFKPTLGSTLKHLENFGPLPYIHFDGATTSVQGSVTRSASGFVPFQATIVALTVDAVHTTAIDQNAAGSNGLHSGIYLDPTAFVIESRDRFSNRVYSGPVSEVQIVETTSSQGSTLLGYFSLSFLDQTVTLPARVGILEMEQALQTIPSLAGVRVSTTSVTTDSTLRGIVAHGDIVVQVQFNLDPALWYQIGDWIRIGDSVSGPVFSVVAIDSFQSTITLSSPYFGPSGIGFSLFSHPRNGYQYVLTFDSAVGDLPALTVNTTLLSDSHFNSPSATVTSCDSSEYQLIQTSTDSGLVSGTFSLVLNGQSTRNLPFDISSSDLTVELEQFDFIYRAHVDRTPLLNGCTSCYQWAIAFVSFDSELSPIFADGHLLQGVGAQISVDSYNCPSASQSGSVVDSIAGQRGEYFSAHVSSSISNTPTRANVSYLSSGLYVASYITPRLGTYQLSIGKAGLSGLKGEYFNNRWMYGEPIETRMDSNLDFFWSTDMSLTSTGKDYISVRWTGFLLPAFSENYTFTLKVNDGARLWLDNTLILDQFDNEVSESQGYSTFSASTTAPLIASQLVPIKVEFKENIGSAMISLSWSSASQGLQVIPSSRLFSSLEEISNSPYTISPIGRKPTSVQDVRLSIDSWDQILCEFDVPSDDGGSEIVGYVVEWFDASVAQSPLSVQTIKLSSNAIGGTFLLTSPSGHQYPYSIPFDIDSSSLADILMRLPDVGQVSVARDFTSGHSWSITFLSDLGPVAALSVDASSLTLSNPLVLQNSIVCSAGLASTHGSLSCLSSESQAGATFLSTLILRSGTEVNGVLYSSVSMNTQVNNTLP